MDRPSGERDNMASVTPVALHCEKFVTRLIDGQLIKTETQVFAVRRDVYGALIKR